MKCDVNTAPQVYLDKFLVLKSHIDLADLKNPLSAMPEYAAMVAVNSLQTIIIGAQLLEKVSKEGMQANLPELSRATPANRIVDS